MVSDEGMETGGICFSATLRDYGRFGLFILNGGVAGGKEVLPKGFLQEATTKRVGTSYPGLDYGYQWWVRQGGVYQGIGIMGQSLYVVPEQELIIVQQSAWTTSGSADDYALQASFVDGVREAIRRRG
jgi:CubicO group peptidase (beta-lactamase class C family)